MIGKENSDRSVAATWNVPPMRTIVSAPEVLHENSRPMVKRSSTTHISASISSQAQADEAQP
jgi:hypothetical protein